jgi:hypothetical protein
MKVRTLLLSIAFLPLFLPFPILPGDLGKEDKKTEEKVQEEEAKEEAGEAKEAAGESYEVRFFSFKRQHGIGKSTVTLKEDGELALEIEDEELEEPQGTYKRTGFQFEATWGGSVTKHNQTLTYDFKIEGLTLFESYIVGILRLTESIKETDQNQEITFLFFGQKKLGGEEPSGGIPFLP